MVEVRNLHLGSIGDALANDGRVEGCDGGGTVLLNASLVRPGVATLAAVASGAGGAGTARTTARGSVVVAGLAGLAGLNDILEGHVESAGHNGVLLLVVRVEKRLVVVLLTNCFNNKKEGTIVSKQSFGIGRDTG